MDCKRRRCPCSLFAISPLAIRLAIDHPALRSVRHGGQPGCRREESAGILSRQPALRWVRPAGAGQPGPVLGLYGAHLGGCADHAYAGAQCLGGLRPHPPCQRAEGPQLHVSHQHPDSARRRSRGAGTGAAEGREPPGCDTDDLLRLPHRQDAVVLDRRAGPRSRLPGARPSPGLLRHGRHGDPGRGRGCAGERLLSPDRAVVEARRSPAGQGC